MILQITCRLKLQCQRSQNGIYVQFVVIFQILIVQAVEWDIAVWNVTIHIWRRAAWNILHDRRFCKIKSNLSSVLLDSQNITMFREIFFSTRLEKREWNVLFSLTVLHPLVMCTMYDFHNSTDTLKFWTEKRAINKTFLFFIRFWWKKFY